jgi:drug/metabolite transporter (DMT)-like permease
MFVTGRALVISRVPWFYLVRSGCSVAALCCIFWSVGELPLGDVTAIIFSSPFFTLALAALLLGERVGNMRWALVAIGFAGVVMIAKPSDSEFTSLEPMAFVALAAAMFIAAELIALRFIALRDSTTTALFLTNAVGMIISGCLAPFFWRSLTDTQWLLIFTMALVTVTGQALFVRAVATTEASTIAPLFYTTLIYAIAFGYFVFGEVPTPQSLIGASLIVTCGLLVGRR